MKTLESLKRKLESAEDLQSVVKTMKSLAAVSIRQYEEAVTSLEEYNNAIDLGFEILMKNQTGFMPHLRTESGSSLGAIVFGSEQGMCGQFNEQIAEFASKKIKILQQDPDKRFILTLGPRVSPLLEDEGLSVQENFSFPGSVEEITWSVQQLLLRIEAWRFEKNIERVTIFYNKKKSGSSYKPYMWSILPLDQDWLNQLREKEWKTNQIPFFSMKWDVLLAHLVRQYFFLHLFRAFAESLASENASRLAAMQAAEKNIEEKLGTIRVQYNQQRQSSITSELLDIVSGFEALKKQ
ncbi:F0F1 ATP synthase subunit gamma [candidate division KSB1 bacterium]|nr:F0F1 ATP synthase subunit gamma [candidate division KSB1 bacterium]